MLLRGLANLRVETRVNDPLTLTALAIESGEEQAILVSVDACGIDEEVPAESRLTPLERSGPAGPGSSPPAGGCGPTGRGRLWKLE